MQFYIGVCVGIAIILVLFVTYCKGYDAGERSNHE
jgi:hypothetical protein